MGVIFIVSVIVSLVLFSIEKRREKALIIWWESLTPEEREVAVNARRGRTRAGLGGLKLYLALSLGIAIFSGVMTLISLF